MKKVVVLSLLLWSLAGLVSAGAAVLRNGPPPDSTDRDSRICLDLMELGGNGEAGEDSMELPPMKGELKTAPEPAPALQLKSPASSSEAETYRAAPLTLPASDDEPGLSPMILAPPGDEGEIEKLPLKPVKADREPASQTPAVSVGRMPGELKSLTPVETTSDGLKMSLPGRKSTAAPFESPEIPLLVDDTTGPKIGTSESTGGVLTLKPVESAAGEGKAGEGAPYPVAGELVDPMSQSLGSELDEKLIAIYEKFYKDRK